MLAPSLILFFWSLLEAAHAFNASRARLSDQAELHLAFAALMAMAAGLLLALTWLAR